MSDQDPDSIKRAALLKQIGVGGVATFVGVVGVEGDAGAQQPYNLDFAASSSIAALLGRHHHSPLATPPPGTPNNAVSSVQIVTAPTSATYQSGWHYAIFSMTTAYIEGIDENGTQHGSDGNPTPKKLQYAIYFVIGSPNPMTC